MLPWFSVTIKYNGDVSFCADFSDYVLGNINHNTLNEICNNERAKEFRQILRNTPDGLFPGCTRCIQLMMFGKKQSEIKEIMCQSAIHRSTIFP